MNKNTLCLAITACMAAFIVGAVAFIFWVTPFLFDQNTQRTEVLLKTLGTASLLAYGTVVSTDTTLNTITIREMSRFPGTPDSQFLLYVDPSAYIARQELRAGPDGAYVELPAATVSPLSDIRPGDHVAILFGHRADNALSTHYILFGNPL